MFSRRSTLALVLLVALGAVAWAPAATAQGPPPIVPLDVDTDPTFRNITADTGEVPFTIKLGAIDDTYTGDYTAELTVDGDHIATVEELWPPDSDHVTLDTEEDADEGPGTWSPSIGTHMLNLTVTSDGEFPLSLPIPIGPDPAIHRMPLQRGDTPGPPAYTQPSTPFQGQDVTFHVNVSNHGTWSTPDDASLPVELSLDNQTLATTEITQPIEASDTVNLTFEDAWTAEAGTHEFEVEVGPDAIEEIDEANNLHRFEVEVRETGLTFTELRADPDPARPNETVVVEANLTNEAPQQAPETVSVLYRNGEPVADADTPALEAGARTNLAWEIQADTGIHELRAAPNAEERPTPPPTDAATAVTELTVGPGPALLAANATPNPAEEGDNVTLTATVANNGSAFDATVPLVVLEDLDGDPIHEASIDGLAANETRELTFGMAPATGEHRLTLRLDPNRTLTEASEANNQRQVHLAVREHVPQLAIRDLGLDETDPFPGQAVPASAVLVNEDDTDLEDLAARFTLDGDPLGERIEIDQLAGGASRDLASRPWQASPGEHELALRVGSPSDLRQDRPLATASTQITVEDRRPDVVVTDLRLTPADPAPGTEVHLTADVVNQGQAPARGLTVAFELDGDRLGIERVDELAPEANTTLQSPSWEAQPGARNASVIVDPDGAVHETHNADRRANLTFSAGQADAPSPGLGLTLLAVSAAVLARAIRRS